MRRTSITLLGSIIVVVMLANAGVSGAFRPKPEKRPTYIAKDEQLEGLPDYGNPVVKAKLDCSACKALVEKLHTDLNDLYKRRDDRPKAFEVVEVTEHLCSRVRDEYGLLMRNNQATTDFSRDERITRMKGAWINSFVEGRCGYLLSHFEEPIIENFGHMRHRVEDLQKLVCYKLDKRCVAAEHTHDEL
jgi:hypothetical protein